MAQRIETKPVDEVELAIAITNKLVDEAPVAVPDDVRDDARALILLAVLGVHGRSGARDLLRRARAKAYGRSSAEMWTEIEQTSRILLDLGTAAHAMVESFIGEIRDTAGAPLHADWTKVAAAVGEARQRKRGARWLTIKIGKLTGNPISSDALKKALARTR